MKHRLLIEVGRTKDRAWDVFVLQGENFEHLVSALTRYVNQADITDINALSICPLNHIEEPFVQCACDFQEHHKSEGDNGQYLVTKFTDDDE